MYGKFFRPTLLKEIELTNYPEKAKEAKNEKHYLQTIRDLGRSYFYINGTKCSISPNASIEETKKKLTASLSQISKLTIELTFRSIKI